jgi:hypothetical protein
MLQIPGKYIVQAKENKYLMTSIIVGTDVKGPVGLSGIWT